MKELTQSERTMMHLYRYRFFNMDAEKVAPFELTQDGIGEALGISRSYASLIVGRMGKEGLIRMGRLAIADDAGRNPRKVYLLSSKGEERCRTLIDGKDPDDILPRNINHCRTDCFDALGREDRDILGALMLIEVPVHHRQVPGGRSVPLLPVDPSGFVSIRRRTRKLYTGRADAETLRRWHSVAADWCADNSSPLDERILHLVSAERIREAAKLAGSNRYAIMDSPDPGTVDALDLISRNPGMDDLAEVAAFSYLRLGMLDKARSAAGRISDDSVCLKGAMMAEILLAEGRRSAALERALDVYCADVRTALVLGKCMAANGRHAEAVVYLRKARRCMTESGCLFRLDEALRWEAESYLSLGNPELALHLLEAAYCSAKDPGVTEMLRNRVDVVSSEDGVGLQGVHI
ncbi:MAG: hypothetical protein A3205_08615 [Methanomassiliicoccales archaeon Mx-03]|nr:MAG: hypothetical protein A3205_08615 [Methanomassiliicoccales archaeon Mx-03]